jgi:hypothetical protein
MASALQEKDDLRRGQPAAVVGAAAALFPATAFRRLLLLRFDSGRNFQIGHVGPPLSTMCASAQDEPTPAAAALPLTCGSSQGQTAAWTGFAMRASGNAFT